MHIYTLSKVYGVCSLCGHKADHPMHHRTQDVTFHVFGRRYSYGEDGIVTLNGLQLFQDGKPLRVGDIVEGEQLTFDFVSSKEK